VKPHVNQKAVNLSLSPNKALKEKMVGVGLRTDHYSHLEESPKTKVDFFEALTENHLGSKGRPYQILEHIRKDYPLTFHGVSLNIAHHTGINFDYLKKVKELVTPFEPMVISDHLCWTGAPESNLHNLLPFPYNQETLNFLCDRVDQVQNYLNRVFVLENLSAYFDYTQSNMSEWDFLKELSLRSGCQILLDVNNIYVNSVNQKFDAKEYLETIPDQSIAEIHLAGFTDMGDFLFDTHSKPVYPEVWELYKLATKKAPHAPTLIEWDDDIPEFNILQNEAIKAKKIIEEVHFEP
tara:strand:+ start:19550 stop:20431 length:882 start_codon:yes stop_codon:yes gene_type:complete